MAEKVTKYAKIKVFDTSIKIQSLVLTENDFEWLLLYSTFLFVSSVKKVPIFLIFGQIWTKICIICKNQDFWLFDQNWVMRFRWKWLLCFLYILIFLYSTYSRKVSDSFWKWKVNKFWKFWKFWKSQVYHVSSKMFKLFKLFKLFKFFKLFKRF